MVWARWSKPRGEGSNAKPSALNCDAGKSTSWALIGSKIRTSVLVGSYVGGVQVSVQSASVLQIVPSRLHAPLAAQVSTPAQSMSAAQARPWSDAQNPFGAHVSVLSDGRFDSVESELGDRRGERVVAQGLQRLDERADLALARRRRRALARGGQRGGGDGGGATLAKPFGYGALCVQLQIGRAQPVGG